MQLNVVHGTAQPLFGQMVIIVPEVCVGIISELQGSFTPAASVFITEEVCLRDACSGFDQAFDYALPIVTPLGDINGKNTLDTLRRDYAEPGGLNILSGSLNPIYASQEAYSTFMIRRSCRSDVLLKRCAEFERLKECMDDALRTGAAVREILSLDGLNRIAEEKCCRMSGAYFGEREAITMDTRMCIDLLEGYIRYLDAFPNLQLLIAGSGVADRDCLWYIKQNRHVAIHLWKKDKPAFIYSDQLVLTHEIQQVFDCLWSGGRYPDIIRSQTIETLKKLIEKLDAPQD
jgi:hypothetical protein